MAAITDKRNILKFVHINFGTYHPFIVKKEISLKLIPFSGRGKALNAAKYQKNICKIKGIFLKISTYHSATLAIK